MHLFLSFILAIISVIHADVSHLASNLQADGYHYEHPSYPFPSENEVIPAQTLSGRNDFNPPAFLAQPKPSPQPQKPAPEYIPPTPQYIRPTPAPTVTNLQEDGYHYQQPSIPFPSTNQQKLSARNDFNPPAFLAQPKPSPQPQKPAPEYIPPTPQYIRPTPAPAEYIPPTPQYIRPTPAPAVTNLQEDGYHYQKPSIPFPSTNQQQLSARNDFNPPAFLAQPKPSPQPQKPAPTPQYIRPTPAPAVYIPPTPQYIRPTPAPAVTNLQEDGYHYQQPSIPFPSTNQQQLSARNDFNPPAFLAQPKPSPQPQKPAPTPQYIRPTPAPAVYIPPTPQYIRPTPAPEVTNLQEDGYHYQQPSIPFESQQTLSGRNDFNPPAFLFSKPEEPAPAEPAPEKPIPEEPVQQEPAPEEPAPVQPVTEPPAPTHVETNLQEDGYHYGEPSIPFTQPEPVQQYNPVAEPEPIQPDISSHFGTAELGPEPSYSLGPSGYNYRVPSRPFRF